MIEVVSYVGSTQWDRAEDCEDEEAAILAGRTLWDEAWTPHFGHARRLVFEVDGKPAFTVTRRP